MVGSKSPNLSPLSDEEVVDEDDNDSTFHREIILQDNYSDDDVSDSPYNASDVTGNGFYANSVRQPIHDNTTDGSHMSGHYTNQRQVRFADGLSHHDGSQYPYMSKPGGSHDDVNKGPSYRFTPSSTFNDSGPMSLLSLLPSSILGNAVSMSKYLSEYIADNVELQQKVRNISNADRRKEFGERIFPESKLSAVFRSIDTTQVAIEGAADLASSYSDPPGALLQLMHDVFVSIPTNSSVTRLGIFYVYNHLLHKYGRVSRNNQPCFAEIGLRRFCIPAITHSSRIHCSNAVHIITCVNVWRQRRIYDSKTCETLESMVSSPSLSSTGEAHKDTSTFSVNSEIGGLKTLRYIFRMPMVDARYEEAIDGIDVDDLINTECLMHNQMLHEAKSRNKYHLFDQVSRLSGQEIILMNSISLDLAGLIEEGGKHLAMLEKDISDIQNRLKDFN